MSIRIIAAFAGLSLFVLGAAGAAHAEGGGGGGGGGNDRIRESEQRYARDNAMVRLRLRGFGDYAEGILPDGTRIRSASIGDGDRIVTTTTPDGLVTEGVRPKGQKANAKGASSRTVYNPQTGITSTFTRYEDGSTIGVHVDRYGNRATSTSMPRR
jgi:hypothetical protein